MLAPESAESEGKPSNCLNCGALLHGKFCYECGQKNLPRRQAIRDLLNNFIGSFTSFESKFFRSIRYLLLSPGYLTKEFNSGKREKYYHPARMYVFLSFIYFLIFFIVTDFSSIDLDQGTIDAMKKSGLDVSFKKYNPPYKTIQEYEATQSALPSGKRDSWIDRYFNKKAIKYKGELERNPEAAFGKIGNNFTSSLPKLFFILLPVFALILHGVYRRRDYFYSEHLVFSIHFYDFCFLTGAIGMVLSQIPHMDWITTVIFLWILIYLFIAMKKVYQQSIGKTILKFFLLSFCFLIAILAGMYVNAIITVIHI
jgi:hypothetical protein